MGAASIEFDYIKPLKEMSWLEGGRESGGGRSLDKMPWSRVEATSLRRMEVAEAPLNLFWLTRNIWLQEDGDGEPVTRVSRS